MQKIAVWVLWAVLLVSATVHSAPTLEDYGSLPTAQQMAVSPDGRLVAFRKVGGGKDQAIIVDMEARKAVNALNLEEIKPRGMRFANNDTLLLWVAKHRRVLGFQGSFDVGTVFAFNLRANKLVQLLTPGDGVVYPGQTGLGRVVGASPDGQYLYMPAFSGEPRQVVGMAADPVYSLLKVRLDGTGTPKIQRGGDIHAEDFFINQQGEILAREDFDERAGLHSILVRRGNGQWDEVYRHEGSLKDYSFMGLTADQQHLVAIDTDDETGRTAYFTMSLAEGKFEGPILGRADADVESVLLDTQRVVLGVEYSGFTPEYQFFDEALNQRVKAIQAEFPEHAVHIADQAPDWRHILVFVEGSQAVGDYYLASEGREMVLVGRAYSNITTDDIHPLGRITFKARDGLSIPTLLTIPVSRVGDMKNLPTVIMPHGGPASYDTIGFDYMAQALAQQGYLVVMPQFRGSSGFGWEHREAGYGEWGRKMQDDLSDAVAFLTGKGMIDPKRVCIVGASYGGYAALAGGAFTPELYRCVVSINGIGDLHDFHNWIKSEQGRSSQSLAYWEMQIGNENYSKEEALARSPENSVANFQAPVLLIYSRNDETVPAKQSERMREALKKQGKPVEYTELEGDDHYLSLGDTRLKALQSMVEFVNRNLQ